MKPPRNHSPQRSLSRRRFLGLGACAGLLLRTTGSLAAGAGNSPDAAAPAQDSARLDVLSAADRGHLWGRVVAAGDLLAAGHRPTSNRESIPQPRVAQRLDAGMEALLGGEPWAQLFGPRDTVAIKINGLASGLLSPRPEVVAAIVAGLRSAGVAAGRIILWDRTSREVERSGFPLQLDPADVRAYGTDALRGGGYSTQLHTFGSVGSLVSRIITQYATALINVGVLKDHNLAGLSAGMKNLYGAIHNPNRYHEHGCDPFVAEVTALGPIRARLRLTVIDAILAQAEGGPAYVADWIWPCDRLLLAVDPVAADRAAADRLDEERARRGLPSLLETDRAPTWIATAARLGLGRAEPIRLIEV